MCAQGAEIEVQVPGGVYLLKMALSDEKIGAAATVTPVSVSLLLYGSGE